MKFFICFFAILFFFSSCKKDKNRPYTIKGRYINSCDGSPVANEEVVISQHGSYGGMYGNSLNSVNLKTFTNSNGEFEINYETNHSAPLTLNNRCEGIPIENIDLGNIPLLFNSKVLYKVKINNPYTSMDTLRFSFSDNVPSVYFMNGPFHDTIIGIKEVTHSKRTSLKYDADLKKIVPLVPIAKVYSSYCININSSVNPFCNNQEAFIGTCNAVADTFVLNIN